MASEKSIATARSFMGRLEDADTRARLLRVDADDTAIDDELLRLHALRGEWSIVIDLAQRLQRRAETRVSMIYRHHDDQSQQHQQQGAGQSYTNPLIDNSKNADVSYSSLIPDSAHASSSSTQADILSVELPYILVQVTAHMKMRQPASAKRVIDDLGNLSDALYIHPVTRRSIVPFSLRFLAAVLPSYMNFPMESISALYALLDECERASDSLRHLSGDCLMQRERLTWNIRIARVRRALIYLHFSRGQYDLAVMLFGKLVAMYECANEHLLSQPGSSSSLPSTRQNNYTPLMQLCSALRLQQFACVSLQSSHFALAYGLLQRIDALSRAKLLSVEETAGRDARIAWTHVQQLNEAFMLVFLGRFDQAERKLRDLSATRLSSNANNVDSNTGIQSMPLHEKQDEEGGLLLRRSIDTDREIRDVQMFNANRDVADIDSEYVTLISRYLHACAQTSHMACLPYTTVYSAYPTRIMSDIEILVEQYVKDNPHLLLSSEAFLGNCVRLYTLAGRRGQKLALLNDLMEVFSCEAMSRLELDKIT